MADRRKPSNADVYVDVQFDAGVLFLVICNDGEHAAEAVRVVVDHPVVDAHGRDLRKLNVFNRLSHMPPGKRIEVFVDETNRFFARRPRTRLRFDTSWKIGRAAFTSRVEHDLRVYQDLPYLASDSDRRRRTH